jgi:hypothetical protein
VLERVSLLGVDHLAHLTAVDLVERVADRGNG